MSINSHLRRIRRRLRQSSYQPDELDKFSTTYDSVRNFLVDQNNAVYLYGFDDFENLGDQALWFSLDILLRGLPKKFRPVGLLSEPTCLSASRFKDKVIVFPGGGSLGNRYHSSRRRVELIENLRPAAIIQMPLSTSFSNDPAVTSDRVMRAYTSMSRALVFVRDEKSRHEALSELGINAELAPDLSSVLPDLGDLHAGGKGTLWLMRSDQESRRWDIAYKIKGTVADWDTMQMPNTYEMRIARLLLHATSTRFWIGVTRSWRLSRWLVGSAIFARIRLQLARVIALNETARALSFLSQFDHVVTDRLHGVLLAQKIGVPVSALDNDHGKISRYLESWNGNEKHGASCELFDNIDAVTFTSKYLDDRADPSKSK